MQRFIAAYRWELALFIAAIAFQWLWLVFSDRVLVPWIGDFSRVSFLVSYVAIALVAAVPLGVLYLRLRHRGYGWEYLLITVIPSVASIFSSAFQLLSITLIDLTSGLSLLIYELALSNAADAAVMALLLVALYRYVSRRRQGFLSLIWLFLLMACVIDLLLTILVAVARRYGDPFLPVWIWRHIFEYSEPILIVLTGPLAVVLLLRLTRSASRLSVAHAFFMVALTFSFPLGRLLSYGDSSGSPQLLTFAVVALAFGLALAMQLFVVWLLGNFELRGPLFHRRSIAAVVAVRFIEAASSALLVTVIRGNAIIFTDDSRELFTVTALIAAWLVVFAAVYLVRVRHPAPEADPTTDAPPTPPSEER